MATRKKKKTTSKAGAAPEVAAGSGYTVLARRYRSRDFDELIGQEPIARTLQNAIKANRTAHAYLFCGTRGVGKTSMARIFAKALNATDDLAQKDQIADAILRGDDLDVIEIDGASNRGIADAKDLIAGAGLSPARCQYKIYIIDEVHALTKEAFNALLKTMEEPPSHVKFILCTTEAHKVPQTIQSRCQRFDFRPIPTARIAEQLRMILDQEKIDADEEVIVHVAQLGNGSMRDALSMLDRLLAAGESKLTSELLEQMIGLPDQQLIIDLTDALIAGDGKLTLERGAALVNRGAPIEQILELLAGHFRHLMILTTCGEESALLELSPEAKKNAIEQAQHFDAPGLVHMIAVCDAVARNTRVSSAARALFDAALVRLAMSDHLADIPALIRGDGAAHSNAAAGKKKAIDERGVANTHVGGSPAKPAASHRVAEIKPPPHPDAPRNAAAPSARAADHPSPRRENATGPIDGETLWRKLLDAASRSEAVRAKVAQFEYRGFDGTTLTVTPASPGAQQWQADMLATVVKHETGRAVQIVLEKSNADTPPTSNRGEDGLSSSSPGADREQVDAARQMPVVQQAIDIFDATIVDVREIPTKPSAHQDKK